MGVITGIVLGHVVRQRLVVVRPVGQGRDIAVRAKSLYLRRDDELLWWHRDDGSKAAQAWAAAQMLLN